MTFQAQKDQIQAQSSQFQPSLQQPQQHFTSQLFSQPTKQYVQYLPYHQNNIRYQRLIEDQQHNIQQLKPSFGEDQEKQQSTFIVDRIISPIKNQETEKPFYTAQKQSLFSQQKYKQPEEKQQPSDQAQEQVQKEIKKIKSYKTHKCLIIFISLFIIAIPLICSYYLYFYKYPLNTFDKLDLHLMIVSCIIYCVTSLFGMILIIFSLSAKRNQQFQRRFESSFGSILFEGLIEIAMTIIWLLFVLFIWKEQYFNFNSTYILAIRAQNSPDFVSHNLYHIVVPLSVIECLLLIFVAFLIFKIKSKNYSLIRVFQYICCLWLLAILYFIFYFYQSIIQLEKGNGMFSNIFTTYSQVGLPIILVISLIFILSTFVANYRYLQYKLHIKIKFRKEKTSMLIIGAMFFFLSIFISITGYFIYLKSTEMNQNLRTQQQCKKALVATNMYYLENFGCYDKYLGYSTVPFLNCPLFEQSYVWETYHQQNLLQQTPQQLCLNFQCCNAVSNSVVIWLILLVCSTFFALTCMIGIIISSFLLFIKNKGKVSKAYERFLIFSLLIILVGGGILTILYKPTIQSHYNIIPQFQEVSFTEFKRSNTMDKYLTSNCKKLSPTLEEYNPVISTGECLTPNCENDGLRTQIFAEDCYFYFSIEQKPYYQELQFFQGEQAKKVEFLKADIFKNFGYIGVQGKLQNVVNFVKKDLYICSRQQIGATYIFPSGNYINEQIILNQQQSKLQSSTLLISPTNILQYDQQKIQEIRYENASNCSQCSQINNFMSQLEYKNMYLKVIDSITGKGIPFAEIKMANGQYSSQCNYEFSKKLESKFINELKADESGLILIYNVQLNQQYTIFVSKEDYFSNCKQLNLFYQYQRIFLSPKLEHSSNQVRLQITWLDPYLSPLLQVGVVNGTQNNFQCLAGEVEPKCDKTTYHKAQFASSPTNLQQQYVGQSQSLTIDQLGDYNYVFFVKNSLSETQYLEEKPNLNQNFMNTLEFETQLYITKLKFPYKYTTGMPVISNQQTQQEALQANELMLILGCIKFQEYNSGKLLYKEMNEFSFGNLTLTNFLPTAMECDFFT